MNKTEFLQRLRNRLSGLPQDDIEERLSFYAEMIEDRIEEGFTEDEAVAAVGSVNDIAAQIVSDIPLTKIVNAKVKPKRRLKVWEIVLLALSLPIWLFLAIAMLAVILLLYISNITQQENAILKEDPHKNTYH